VVAAGGAILNIPLNALLVFGAGWGIVGSAVGTVLCQCLMAGVLLGAVVRYARTHQVPLRPHLDQVMDTGRESVPMFLRSVSLRLVMVVTVVVAARLGDVQLAAHQLANTIFGLLALALDSLAIAGQALTGRHLGARQTEVVRTITRRLMTWGVLGGLVVGLLLLAASYGAPTLFSPDPAVQENLRAALWVLVIAQPVAGYVFVLDGVLMGAGDAPYLAKAGMITALAVMPGAIAVGVLTPIGPWGTACLWIATNLLYMVARAISLGLRVRTDTWMHVEA
jgi:putative MATE family efflux protein